MSDKQDDKYTYFKVEIKDWAEDFDYTICESLNGVLKILKLAEIYLDDPEIDTRIIITGIGLTKKQYAEFKKSIKRP